MDPISAIILSGMLAPIVLRFLGNAATDVIATAKGQEAPSHTRWKASQARRVARGERPEKPPGRTRRWWRDSVERANAKAAHKQAAALERMDENADQIKDRHKEKLAKREARKDWARDRLAKGAGLSWDMTKAAARGTADVVSPARRAEKRAWNMNSGKPEIGDVPSPPVSPERLAKDMLDKHAREQERGETLGGQPGDGDGGTILNFPKSRTGNPGREPRADDVFPRVAPQPPPQPQPQSPPPPPPTQNTAAEPAQPRPDGGPDGAAQPRGERTMPGPADGAAWPNARGEEWRRGADAAQRAWQQTAERLAQERARERMDWSASAPPRPGPPPAQDAQPGTVAATATRLTDPPYGTVPRSAEDLAKDTEAKRANREHGNVRVLEGATAPDPNRTAEGRLVLPAGAASNEGNAVTAPITGEITDLYSTLAYFQAAGQYVGTVAAAYEVPIAQTEKVRESLRRMVAHSETALNQLKLAGFQKAESLKAPTEAFTEANELAGDMDRLQRELTAGRDRLASLQKLFTAAYSGYAVKQGAIAETAKAAGDTAKNTKYYLQSG
uniref:hypothetical protein n=1 Tax=Amycolatopsis sp. CA-096443 TaxID=3239919 RepID=UPI003F493EB5